MLQRIAPAPAPLKGNIAVPHDKSISHRALLFSAMAEGTSRLKGLLDAADVRSTADAVRALGAQVETTPAGRASFDAVVTGWGGRGPATPDRPLDCGNSGTTARLLAGVLAGWDVPVTLTGDESLSRRPMKRVTEPLTLMGARFETTEEGTLPMTVRGGVLTGMRHDLSTSSAQVKTALLLAGLRAHGRTTVREPEASRDHTERMLPSFGVPIGRDDLHHESWVDGPQQPLASDLTVPGDPSSAAFLVAAALLVDDSEIMLENVLLNPTRVGFMSVLERMGAGVRVHPRGLSCQEAVGDIEAHYVKDTLVCTNVDEREVPQLVDEVPVLALVAAAARGVSRFEGLSELRVKESDRLQAVADGLEALGAKVRSGHDWLEVEGPTAFRSATLDSLGDHRLAMTFAVAGLVAPGGVAIERFEAVDVSYPGFLEDLQTLTSAQAG